jgi:hypothetical protein
MKENYSESKVTLYPPFFNGTKEQFRFYEKKMHAYLTAARCRRVLRAAESEIRADAYDWETVDVLGQQIHTDEEVEEGKKLHTLTRRLQASLSTRSLPRRRQKNNPGNS